MECTTHDVGVYCGETWPIGTWITWSAIFLLILFGYVSSLKWFMRKTGMSRWRLITFGCAIPILIVTMLLYLSQGD